MKITRIEIENFGKLSNYSLDFTKDITAVYEENGFGKSTLAVFIMTMFYGFDKDRSKNSLSKFDTYEPWQGGAYGGSLSFECDRGNYRIERIFRKRNPIFKLYNTDSGLESSDFTEKIGDEIFGIDIDAFIKSIYVPQRDLTDGMPNSIMERLNDSSIDYNDINSYDRAIKKLDDERKKYKLLVGKGGKYWDTYNEIKKAEQRIEIIESNLVKLPSLEARINEIDKKVEELSREENEKNGDVTKLTVESVKHEAIIKNYNTYVQKSTVLSELKKKILEGQEFFKEKKQPTDEEISEAYSDNTTYNNICEMRQDKLSETDKENLEKYRKVFNDGIPSNDEIKTARSACTSNNTSSNNELQIQSKINMIQAEKKLKEQNDKKKNPFIGLVVAGLAFVGIAMSIVLAIVSKTILPFVILAVACILFFVLGIIYYNNIKIKQKDTILLDEESDEEKRLLRELNDIRKSIKENEEIIKAFRQKYNLTDSDFLTELSNLEINIEKYNNLIIKEQELLEKQKEHEQKIINAKSKITDFLSKYYEIENSSNFQNLLNNLKSHCRNLGDNQREYNDKKNDLDEFIEKNAVDINFVPEKNDNKDVIEKTINEIKMIRSNISTLKDVRNNTVKQISDLNNEQQELIVLQETKEKLQEDLEVYGYRYDIIEKTKDMLGEARKNLSLRYLEPIKKSFEKYSSMLTKNGLGNFVIDSNFNVSLFEYGQQRSSDYFSKGYKSIIDICLRFSMIDALFDKEKPVVILDDPFANLDDEKLQLAKELLHNISKEIQVIYFACHESRKI